MKCLQLVFGAAFGSCETAATAEFIQVPQFFRGHFLLHKQGSLGAAGPGAAPNDHSSQEVI